MKMHLEMEMKLKMKMGMKMGMKVKMKMKMRMKMEMMMLMLFVSVKEERRTRGCAGPHALHQPPPPGAARAAPAAARGLSRRKRRASRHAGRPAFVFSCGSHRHASCSSPPGGSPHTAARPTSGSLRRHDLAARATWQLAPPSSASPSSGGPPGETNSRGGT